MWGGIYEECHVKLIPFSHLTFRTTRRITSIMMDPFISSRHIQLNFAIHSASSNSFLKSANPSSVATRPKLLLLFRQLTPNNVHFQLHLQLFDWICKTSGRRRGANNSQNPIISRDLSFHCQTQTQNEEKMKSRLGALKFLLLELSYRLTKKVYSASFFRNFRLSSHILDWVFDEREKLFRL